MLSWYDELPRLVIVMLFSLMFLVCEWRVAKLLGLLLVLPCIYLVVKMAVFGILDIRRFFQR